MRHSLSHLVRGAVTCRLGTFEFAQFRDFLASLTRYFQVGLPAHALGYSRVSLGRLDLGALDVAQNGTLSEAGSPAPAQTTVSAGSLTAYQTLDESAAIKPE